MNDLISRAAVIEAVLNDERIERNYGDVSLEGVIKVIESLPAVDAVPVVFCKDCKYAHMTYDGEVKYCDRISMPDDEGDYGYALYLPGDWFCAAGERRDEDATD